MMDGSIKNKIIMGWCGSAILLNMLTLTAYTLYGFHLIFVGNYIVGFFILFHSTSGVLYALYDENKHRCEKCNWVPEDKNYCEIAL